MSTHSERFNPPTFESKIGLKTAKNGAYPFNIAEKRPKNGALPFTCCESGILDTQIAPKTEHCRSLRKMKVAAIKMVATEKRSISVHFSTLSYVICM